MMHQRSIILLLTAALSPHVIADPVIDIDGAPDILAENIRNHLSLSKEACDSPDWRLQALSRKADAEIRNAAHALGYYKIESNKKFSPGPGCWSLQLTIKPGPPILVENLNISLQGEGKNDDVFADLISRIELQPGSQFNHGKYESIKSSLSILAAARGYFDAKFEESVARINTRTNRADIYILYDTGARYRFGEISIHQDILSDEFINRFITFQPGEYYHNEKLVDLQQALSARYFSQVDVTPLLDQARNGIVPIKVEPHPLKQHSFSVGAGVTTDTGPRLKLAYENRYANPQGHHFNTELSLSPVRSEMQASYTIPLRAPTHENLRFFTGYVEEDTETSSSRISTLGSNYSFLTRHRWLQTYALNFKREDFIIAGETERTNLLVPSLSLAKSSDLQSVYPLHGWRLNGLVQGASEKLASDISFLQFYGSAKYIRPFGGGRILLRAEGGTTDVQDFDELPASLRFFAGGDASVRGYEYQSLGPLNEEGQVIGGKRLLVWSTEYDYRFSEKWVVAAFYDAGNAFNERSNYELKHGAGLGVRWLSPIGPIRIDFAKALDDDEEWRLHLSMGPDL